MSNFTPGCPFPPTGDEEETQPKDQCEKEDAAEKKTPNKKAKVAEGKDADVEEETGPLLGKIVRVIDESLRKVAWGQKGKVTRYSEGKIFFFTGDNGASGGHAKADKARSISAMLPMYCRPDQVEVLAGLRDPAKRKAVQMPKDVKIELCHQFPTEELQAVDLLVDSRFASIHLNLWWWSVERDLKEDATVFVRPELVQMMLHCHLREDGAHQLHSAIRTLLVRFEKRKQMLLPVWSSCTGPGDEHWTLLSLTKEAAGDAPDTMIEVRYFDSLHGGESPYNRSAAEVILRFLAAGLTSQRFQIVTDLPARCNCATQGAGNGIDCGPMVCFYGEVEARRARGEGHAGLPWPNAKGPRDRINALVATIRKHSGLLQKEEVKLQEIIKKEKEMKEQELKRMHQQMTQKAYLAEIAKLAEEKLQKGLGIQFGCDKCRWHYSGSTCCNPDKMLAKENAQKIRKDVLGGEGPPEGEYDEKIYLIELKKIWHLHLVEIQKSMLRKDRGGGCRMDIVF